MSHHMQVGIPNLPLGTWWRTQTVGINQGMIYAPLLPSCIHISSVKSCVCECKKKHRENRREVRTAERACVSGVESRRVFSSSFVCIVSLSD
jgi:hypothetical protein